MLPDFGAGGVGTRSEAKGDIPGVAFSWLLLLAKCIDRGHGEHMYEDMVNTLANHSSRKSSCMKR